MPAPIPIATGTVTLASFALTFIVIGNAYYHKKQFYPSIVYITKSNPSMAAIYLQAFTLVLLFGKVIKKLFFGQLRAAELEQLIERSFYAVTETCLAFTVFRDDFSPKFVALFTILLFLKAFHYLTDSRVDFMERSPTVTGLFHLRVASLILSLVVLDIMLVFFSYQTTMLQGPSVQLVFGFEYAILLTVIFNVFVKYVCHTLDLQYEAPWDNKAVYLLYTELLIGFVKVVLYAAFLFIMIRIHTFPLFIIRPMYLTLRSFKNALNGVIQSRRAIHNMNTLYADATEEELSAVDNVCIICREEMTTGAKKLPCNHIFHTSCLRSWFQRQQTCPTCRMDILRHGTSVTPPAAQQPINEREPQHQQETQPQQTATQHNNQQQPPQHFNMTNGNPPNVFPQGIFPPQFPFMPFPLQQQAAPAQKDSEGAAVIGDNKTASETAIPFAPMPLLMPTPPINFAGLTLEELQKMEGVERANVEARMRNLRNIQTLLDAASLQLSQYYSVVNHLKPTQTSEKEDKSSVENEASSNTEDPTKSSESSDELGATTVIDPEDTNELRRRRLQKFSSNIEN